MMPEMDGLALCRALKTQFATSHIPVILLTARRTSPDQQVDGLDTGADDYIVKPFHPALLQARVRNLIDSRRHLRERFKHEITLQPSEVTPTSLDEQFLAQAVEVVETRIDDPAFTVDSLPMSRTAVYAKFKDLSDLTPGEFIRLVRMKRAAQLLTTSDLNITQVTYAVGYTDLKYFRQAFKQQFGMTPSVYMKKPAADRVRMAERGALR